MCVGILTLLSKNEVMKNLNNKKKGKKLRNSNVLSKALKNLTTKHVTPFVFLFMYCKFSFNSLPDVEHCSWQLLSPWLSKFVALVHSLFDATLPQRCFQTIVTHGNHCFKQKTIDIQGTVYCAVSIPAGFHWKCVHVGQRVISYYMYFHLYFIHCITTIKWSSQALPVYYRAVKLIAISC